MNTDNTTPLAPDEREAFEAWARENGYSTESNFLRNCYTRASTQIVWESWQASASRRTPAPSVAAQPAPPAKSDHVCGMQGYNGMIDPPCPGCERNRAARASSTGETK